MSWRTVYIESDQNLKIKNNSLIIEGRDEKIKLFLQDIDIIIIDNTRTNISIPTIIECTKHNIPIIIDNNYHDPSAIILNLSGHHNPLKNFNKQLNLSLRDKQRIWKQIIIQKIANQRNLLVDLKTKINCSDDDLEKMKIYLKRVNQGDTQNMEAVAAKLYFQKLFGIYGEFARKGPNAINGALNYGYKILASRISSAIIKFGLNPTLGFNHKDQLNYFNLTYDLIEPFRPFIDWIVHDNNQLIQDDKLELILRIKLIKVLSLDVIIAGKITKIKNAIDMMVKSIISYLEGKRDDLILPELHLPLNIRKKLENEEQGISF
ncbi:MAG: CRISPR-associated endonuclease Cas1 [Candidatus Hepatoplasma scabrum]|nr:MAG: CRISPR-associated endonuclease Cas1 [Candidatus Hepatoplasma sp.]